MGMWVAHLANQLVGINYRRSLLLVGIFLFITVSAFTVWHVNHIAAINGVTLLVRAEELKTFTEYYSYIFFGLPSCLIILGSAHIDLIEKWHISRSFIFLGDASYAIYLTHSDIINLFTLLIKRFWYYNVDITVIPIICISVLIGCLIHKYIEKYLLYFLNQRINNLNFS